MLTVVFTSSFIHTVILTVEAGEAASNLSRTAGTDAALFIFVFFVLPFGGNSLCLC